MGGGGGLINFLPVKRVLIRSRLGKGYGRPRASGK